MKIRAFGKWLVFCVILTYIMWIVGPNMNQVGRLVDRLGEIEGNFGRLTREKPAIMQRFRNFEAGARRLLAR
jgi:hypothetical protein